MVKVPQALWLGKQPTYYRLHTDVGKPSMYEEAIATPDADTWQQAMISEMDSIE